MKKAISILLLLSTICLNAQVKGNGITKDVTFSTSGIKSIELQLYAQVVVDASMSDGITITGDENLIGLITTEVVNGKLLLEQKEWIQPSEEIKILIGAPLVEEILVDVHRSLLVRNLSSERLKLSAPIGKIIAKGSVKELTVFSKNGKIDGSLLESETAEITISGSGKLILNTKRILSSELSERARLELVDQPDISNGLVQEAIARNATTKNKGLKTVNLRLKNNSWNRQKLIVIGPKRDGTTFSYGFPLMPGASRAERWTEGTEVYKQNIIGKKKLLVRISSEDDGKTVKLFN